MPYIGAHDHCGNNKRELKNSKKCGCFYCLAIFSPQKIDRFIDDGQTALCPFCGIDAVIGDAAGYSLTSSFLQEMHDYWFSPVENDK
ncbi:MAG: cytoplasmic protein [Clostridia bacterium]|nr:cytoplasmic protein [Clostridia bacterium]